MKIALRPNFFNRDATEVAYELIGKYLVMETADAQHASMITETEAYIGPEDKACHSSKGRTPRTEPMFDEPGTIYIYFTYGMHYMLNVVTGPKDFPAAILIRGLQDVTGPGRLTKKLGIDKRFNHRPLGTKTGLWIEDRGVHIKKTEIAKTPRIGIDYAGEWRDKLFRYVLKQ